MNKGVCHKNKVIVPQLLLGWINIAFINACVSMIQKFTSYDRKIMKFILTLK